MTGSNRYRLFTRLSNDRSWPRPAFRTVVVDSIYAKQRTQVDVHLMYTLTGHSETQL